MGAPLPVVLSRDEMRRVLEQLARVHTRHQKDRQAGEGRVKLPYALARKMPNAAREWGWQGVFPASRIATDPRSGERYRHHLHPSVLQRAVSRAGVEAGLARRVTCHVLRHHADSWIMPRSRRWKAVRRGLAAISLDLESA
jgi:hypothetical protein